MGTKTNVVVSGISIVLTIDGTDVGFTEDGVTVEHTVEHYDIEADQSINILGKVKVKETMRITVNAEEASLANIKIAMGEENSLVTSGGTSRLSFGGGTTVTEHVLRFTGKAPGTSKTRVLNIYKAVSVDVGANSYKKGDKTLLPLTFEAIADTDKPEGEQYGYYQDTI